MTISERGRISRMDGQPTRAGWYRRVPQAWLAWAVFVKRPALPQAIDPHPARGLKAVLALFGLDLLLMAVLLGTFGLAMTLGLEMPAHMLDELELTHGLIALIIVGAPLAEEIVFRGWLSGRPGHLLASPAAIAGVIALLMSGAAFAQGQTAAQPYLLTAAVATGFALAALFLLRRRGAVSWFRRNFLWFFWASAILFAAIHLTNFAAAGAAMLPLVLPQFVLALILGYLRVHHGLWSAVLLHALHNSVFISLVLFGAG